MSLIRSIFCILLSWNAVQNANAAETAHSKSKMMPTRPYSADKKTIFQVGIQTAYFRGDLIPLSIELIRSAKSKEDFIQRQRQVNRLTLLHGLCQSELKEERNPYHCFRVLEMEEAMKFLSSISVNRTRAFLDEHCHIAVHEQPILSRDEVRALSPTCTSIFHLSERRQRYVLSETQPITRFNSRFLATGSPEIQSGAATERPHARRSATNSLK